MYQFLPISADRRIILRTYISNTELHGCIIIMIFFFATRNFAS